MALQDVEVLMGLPVDGKLGMDQSHDDWLHIFQVILSVTPPTK